jgi:glycosyltransferase involved in cell wall biosynthesis
VTDRVVLVPAVTDPVGVATHVRNLARLLAADDRLDSVVCPARGWLVDRLEADGLPVEIVPFGYRPGAALAGSVRLARALAARRTAGVVHLHGRLPVTVASLAMARLRRLAFVATVHEFATTRCGGPFGVKTAVERVLLARLDGIVAVSRALAEETSARVGRQAGGRVVHIPNWIEPLGTGGPAASGPAPRAPLRLCAVGRLTPEKGFDLLIEAVARLTARGVAVTCDIFGDGPERAALAALIAARALERRVVLRDADPEIRRRLGDHHVLVVPSRQEAFGLVVLEAYDAGLPVVATDVRGLAEVVEAGVSGVCVPPEDPEALASGIARFRDEPGLAARIAAGGRARLASYVAGPLLTERYRRFYAAARLRRAASRGGL